MSASRVDALQRQETEPRSSVYKIHSWCLRRQEGRARRRVAAYRSPLCVHPEALTTLEFCSCSHPEGCEVAREDMSWIVPARCLHARSRAARWDKTLL